MTTMRAVALGLLLVAGSAAGAQAQGRGGQPPRAPRGQVGAEMHAGLMRGIQLSAEERAKVQQVHERYRPQFQQAMEASRDANRAAMQQMRDARQKGDTAAVRSIRQDVEARNASVRPLMEKLRADLRAALTPEHQRQFDANVARMQARASARPGSGRHPAVHAGRRGGGARRAGPRARAQRLALTEQERAGMKRVSEKYAPRVASVRQAMAPDAQALREARQRGDTAAARVALAKVAQHRATIEALQEQQRVEARATLSPERQQQLDSLRGRQARPARAGQPGRPARVRGK